MNVVCALIGLFIVLIVGLGWIIPLIIGIVKRKKTTGVVLLILSFCWIGVVCIATAGLFFFAQSQSKQYEIVKFDPDTYDGPVGAIKVNYPVKTILNMTDKKENKRISLHSDSNQLTAPCGSFELFRYCGTIDTDDGTSWSLETYLYGKKCYVDVQSNSVVDLVFGPPLEASVSHRIQKPTITLNFLLEDSAGNKYSINRVNKRLPPPKFNVIDSAGAIAWSGSFAYG